MRIIGLAGWSGSGKTTLIKKLIPRLIARGLTVSTLKHAHHGFDLDQPGKDSFFHRTAGATEVIISSAKRWAILHELREQPEWDLPALVGKMSPVDLVLVEGFKRDAFPKLEIHRIANGKPLIHPEDPHIVAVASDSALPQARVPVVDLNDIEAIADLLLKHAVPVGGDWTERVMAQLTDDCFAFSGPLLPLPDMERLIGERVTPVTETERVSLRAARGRVAAADVKAPVDLPPFDNSAVDGYAVRHADLRGDGDSRLTIAGRLTAGARADVALKPGEAIRIFTGAAMPQGADTVFMQEDVTVQKPSMAIM